VAFFIGGLNLKTICGFGVNDAGYTVKPSINGVRRRCQFYVTWARMIERCYGLKTQIRQPKYSGTVVCDEWRYFSNFKAWMETQDWEGKELDKDLLGDGKLYSPDTCCFITAHINLFIQSNKKGKFMTGVRYASNNTVVSFKAQCGNPFTRINEDIDYFKTELEAHKAWQAKKHEYACQLSELQEDPRVAQALRERYAPEKDWTNN